MTRHPLIAPPTDVTAVGGVVTDQSGRWLRYQRLANQTEYTAIVSNKWYQRGVLNSIKTLTLPVGSIEFKSAWKILNGPEIRSGRYYTTQAIVYNTPDGAKSPGPNPVTLGLVGLHIIHKTPTQGGFFWSTFEQVDNDTVFIDPHKGGPYNKQTAQKPYTELNQNATPDQRAGADQAQQQDRGRPGAQCLLSEAPEWLGVRPLSPGLDAVADRRRAARHAGKRRQHRYRNLCAGRRHDGSGGAPHSGKLLPPAKPGLPAFGPTPPIGCLGCHINATAANGTTVTDHSFLFLEAQ